MVTGDAVQQSNVFWFSEMLDQRSLLPRCAEKTLRQDIASFEGIAQLCLLVGRAVGQIPPVGVTQRFHQLCDAIETAASLRKKFLAQVPPAYVVQAVGFHCCRLGVSLDPEDVAGIWNQCANNLGRSCLEGFNPGRQV